MKNYSGVAKHQAFTAISAHTTKNKVSATCKILEERDGMKHHI